MLEDHLNREVQYWRFMSVYEVAHAMVVIQGCISLCWLFTTFYPQSTIRKGLFVVATGAGCKLLHVSAKLNLAVQDQP